MPDTLHVAGGHVKNPVLMELYSDATGCKVVVPKMNEAVLLGTAMAASVACGLYARISQKLAAAMYPGGEERLPECSKAGALRPRLSQVACACIATAPNWRRWSRRL